MSTQSEALSAYVTTLPEAIGVIDRLESQNIALKKTVFELTATQTVLDAEIAKLREQEPVAWPETPEQVRDFVGGNFDWKTADEMNPSSSDKYCLTAHDLISAFECWSDTHQAPSHQSESELVSALAACRDAFPVPAEGEPGDAELQSAMADPLVVPEYVRVMVGQQSGYTAVDMSTAAADGYRDGREAMRQEIAGQAVGVPNDLIDRLVAVSSAIADQDDKTAQSVLRETLTMLAAARLQAEWLQPMIERCFGMLAAAPQAPAPTTQPAALSDFLRTYNLQSAYAAHVDRWGQQTPQAPTNTPIGAASMPANYGRFVAQHQAPAPAQWIDPNDKTQKQYLPHIDEKVLFCHDGQIYFGKHTGGSFVTGAGITRQDFNTWECFWMYPPTAALRAKNGGAA